MTSRLTASVECIRFSHATIYSYESDGELYGKTQPGTFMEFEGPIGIGDLQVGEFEIVSDIFTPRDLFLQATLREYLTFEGRAGRTVSTLGRTGLYCYFVNNITEEGVTLLPTGVAVAEPLEQMSPRLKAFLCQLPAHRVEQMGYAETVALIEQERRRKSDSDRYS